MNPQGGHFSDCPLKQAVINKVIIKKYISNFSGAQ
jgi:hypothetical protein